jgi:hypothetical protein
MATDSRQVQEEHERISRSELASNAQLTHFYLKANRFTKHLEGSVIWSSCCECTRVNISGVLINSVCQLG